MDRAKAFLESPAYRDEVLGVEVRGGRVCKGEEYVDVDGDGVSLTYAEYPGGSRWIDLEEAENLRDVMIVACREAREFQAAIAPQPDPRLSHLPDVLRAMAEEFLARHNAQDTNFEVSDIYKESGLRKGHRFIELRWKHEDFGASIKLSTIGDIYRYFYALGLRSEKWSRENTCSADFAVFLKRFKAEKS